MEIQPSRDRMNIFKARHLIALRTPSSEPDKYVFSFILDDKIICSWCLDVLNI